MEAVTVPLDTILGAYFAFLLSMAEMLLPQPTVAQGATNMKNPSNFCPILLAWGSTLFEF
jgi:hypothetical protein